MTDADAFDELRRAVERLYLLTKDPQPGLFTWHQALESAVDDVHRLYYGDEEF
jgi:hypothetical protein